MSKLSIFAGAFLLFVSTATVAAGEDTNLLQNGNFENKHEGWSTWIWSRDGSECASSSLGCSISGPKLVQK